MVINMSQYGWSNAPDAVRQTVKKLVNHLQEVLKDDLTGVYLHGSLAMQCFNPDLSDIDVLVVSRQRVQPEQRRIIARYLVNHSARPHPIELSIVRESALFPWQHPAPFELYYSEAQRILFEDHIFDGLWPGWTRHDQTNVDLAAHIAVIRERGLVVYGREVAYTFPQVPVPHYVDAIVKDVHHAREMLLHDPVYAVLNLCRVYCYLEDSKIVSKVEGAQWALPRLDKTYHAVLNASLDFYTGKAQVLPFDPLDLATFIGYVEAKVTELLYRRNMS